jgi:CheY-like chemotaxis protein/anti-sigma regulatory factor (Ser/Thr protein kinase)
VTLAEAVHTAVETASPAIEEGGHELTVSLPGTPVILDADLTRLTQVFGNLLSNSAKYTPKGGRIGLSAERRNGEVLISVRDTGIGIPEQFLPTIFDMFSQVDRSFERSSGGLGIGLALVRGLVEMHGGTVSAASAGENKGSTFTITLPVVVGRREPTDPPQATATIGPMLRILVVDDSRDGAESMAAMLGLLNHDVSTAHDGVEAVEAAQRFRPDVILMDVGMPRLNGLDATRRIREQPWGKEIRIIALTGWGQENDRERSRDAGCDGHMVKPVSLADIQNLLRKLDLE